MVDGPARRAVSCHLCNEKFFPASLPFHVKQCEKRRAAREVPCPYCQKYVIQLHLPEHVKVCPKGAGGRKKTAPRSSSNPPSGAGEPSQATLRPEQAEASLDDGRFEPQVLDDGRMGCVYCGRFFGPDRIDKHQQICGKLKNARPNGVDGKSTQVSTKVFNAAAQRKGSGACFISQQAHKRKQEAAQASTKKPIVSKDSTWRHAHEEFQKVCRAARGESVPASSSSGPPPGAVTCPHCSRHFAADAAERHIPICRNVVNRPKPPPSPSVQSRSATPSRSALRGSRADSPGVGVRTLRPAECDNELSPSSSRQRTRSGTPTKRDPRSSSSGRLPTVSNANSAGGASTAIRDLRRYNSSDKLPQLGGSPGDSRASVRDGAGPARKPPTAPRQRTLDSTTLPGDHGEASDDGANDQVSQHGGGTVSRVGLRRCAMMYRLLNQVPTEFLARELEECGVDTAAELDHEGLIEAIIEQLA